MEWRRIHWNLRAESASPDGVTTWRDPDGAADGPMASPDPVGDGGDGWLFLLCDRAAANPQTAAPDALAALLHRLGLADTHHVSTNSDDSIRLTLSGTTIDLFNHAMARAVLGRALDGPHPAAGHAPEPPMLDNGNVLALRLVDRSIVGRAGRVQHLCAVAALLTPIFGARHIFWQPAMLWSDAATLGRAVIATESSGVPPVLHLIAFTPHHHSGHDANHGDGDARESLLSSGLNWFSGFELLLDAPATMPIVEILRRAARLTVDAMVRGDGGSSIDVPGLSPGEIIRIARLRHGRDGSLLRATIISSGKSGSGSINPGTKGAGR